jgi:hypothetical protein
MLQVQWWLELFIFLEILQHPIEHLGVTAVWSCWSVEVCKLASNPEGGKKCDHLCRSNPLPGVEKFPTQLVASLDVKTLSPRPLHVLLQARYRRHRTTADLLTEIESKEFLMENTKKS